MEVTFHERQMAQHFLLSAKARTLNLATVMRMTDLQAEQVFADIRWVESRCSPRSESSSPGQVPGP